MSILSYSIKPLTLAQQIGLTRKRDATSFQSRAGWTFKEALALAHNKELELNNVQLSVEPFLFECKGVSEQEVCRMCLLNLGQETLRGLFSRWLMCRWQKTAGLPIANGDLKSSREAGNGNHTSGTVSANLESHSVSENANPVVYPAFDFSASSSPSIISEGSQGGWRKKLWLLEEIEDEKSLPSWCLECLLHGRLPPRENTKCSFYLHPYQGSIAPVITQGKLSAPRILRINKVINYVLERLVLERPPEESSASHSSSQQHTVNGGSSRSSMKTWQLGMRPEIEIFCNQQLLRSEMSLATVRQYIWKKPDDLYLYYRVSSNK
ncbi:hypothetical protein L7F22_008515 [Adiantum nelumboides]|nr:hypothetical protein [Adiantum nelumboides]